MLEAIARLSKRVNNDDVMLLVYEYFNKFKVTDETFEAQIAAKLDDIKYIVIGDRNDIKDGVMYIGGVNSNVYIACGLLVGMCHNKVSGDIKQEFTQVAYMRIMAVLMSEMIREEVRTVREYEDDFITYFHTWDTRYAFLEDYVMRLARLYEKTCRSAVIKDFFTRDFFTKYYVQLAEEEKECLLRFLVRINKVALAINEDNKSYQNKRHFYYAWGDLQHMEKIRKIRPSSYLNPSIRI